MDGKFNTPRTVCKAILAVAITAVAVAAIIGCESIGGGTRKQNIAAVIQTAYDLGGREAVSNKIESLVAEGKLTPSQAVRLHALAQLAYEGIMDDLATGDAARNAAPASASQGGCDSCSIPGASSDCVGGGCTDGCSDCQPDAASDGGCNEDAQCGNCEDCKAQG